MCCIMALLVFSGCAGPITEPGRQDGPKIITTNFPLFDFTRVIAQGQCSIAQLLPPGAESHSYEPSPRNIINIQECDLFLYIGGENDQWIKNILDSLGESAPESLALMDCVQTLPEVEIEGMTEVGHNHEHGESCGLEHGTDEHIWTSLRNAQLMVSAICERLCAIDPEYADTYRKNAEAYCIQLEELDGRFVQMVDSAARKSIVVGDRFPLLYFAQDYGIEWHAAFPGCSAQTEPSAATVAFLTDYIRSEELPVVFYIEFSNHKVADAIAEATGVETALLHSCHNVTREQLDVGVSYLSLMEQNYITLSEALN